MSGELVPGLERSEDFEVDAGLLTDVGGTIGGEVLSTPGMIAMMERNAVKLAYESLPEGKATVGFEVCVRHVGAAVRGARCTVYARLAEIVDGSKLRFEVEVREGDRTVGVGTHERRLVDAASFSS